MDEKLNIEEIESRVPEKTELLKAVAKFFQPFENVYNRLTWFDGWSCEGFHSLCDGYVKLQTYMNYWDLCQLRENKAIDDYISHLEWMYKLEKDLDKDAPLPKEHQDGFDEWAQQDWDVTLIAKVIFRQIQNNDDVELYLYVANCYEHSIADIGEKTIKTAFTQEPTDDPREYNIKVNDIEETMTEIRKFFEDLNFQGLINNY